MWKFDVHCFLALAAFALATCAIGCRRADIREMTVEMPALSEADKPIVTRALSQYAGVDKTSFKWDLEKKTLTLKYDSMTVAQTNIRMAIEAKGVKVVFPENTTGRAGH